MSNLHGSINTKINLSGELFKMGTKGYSAYEIAVQQGFKGTVDEWLQTLTGPQGPQGPMGPSNIYVGDEEPTDKNINVWFDTDEEADIPTGGVVEEIDPTVPAHVKAITIDDIDKWNAGGDVDLSTYATKKYVDDAVSNISGEGISDAVNDWINEHPEAVTTVADHSLSPNKMDWMYKTELQNIFNPAEYKLKTDITDKGVEVESGYLGCTGYMPVTPDVYTTNTGGKPWYYAIYDSDKTFIKRLTPPESIIFDLTEYPNVAYLRLVYYGSAAKDLMVSKNMPEKYIAFDDIDNIRTDITDNTVVRAVGRASAQYFMTDSINDAIPEHSIPVDKLIPFVPYLPNLFNKDEMEAGAVGSNGGDLAYDGNFRSGYIPVKEGVTYYFYTPSAMGTNYASWVYDADKNPVVRITEGVKSYTIPIGINAAYIRIGSVSADSVVSEETPAMANIPYVPSFRMVGGEAVRVDLESYLSGTYGKRIYCIGDSITAGYTEVGKVNTPWSTILNRDYRYNTTNYGITGTTLSTTKANNMSERLKSYDPDGCDICLVMGGFNDAGENVPYGDIDSTDTATIYGALNDICNTLTTKYRAAGKRVALITPPKYRVGPVWELNTAIREVGAKWGVHVIDLDKEMLPICQTDEIKTIFCADGVHPLDPGQEEIARIIAGHIPLL